MKFIKSIKKAAILATAVTVAGAYLLAPSVAAVPYQGENTVGMDSPQFNVFTGVPSVGNEADFLRGKEESSTGYVNDVQSACNNGTRYTLRVYVHNGAKDTLNNNGNGSGVAKGVKVKVALPTQESSNLPINGTISSANAGSMDDDMTIKCNNGKTVKLGYVAGSAQQWTAVSGTKPLNDSIVTTGAPIGTYTPNGDVWGCWDQRVWVTLTVKVEEVPDKPKPSLGECKLLDVKTVGGRKITYELSGTTDNAEIVGYRVNFGDGNSSEEQSGEHEYAEDGSYTVTGEVRVKFADGKEEWKSANDCIKQVTFESGKPPKITPPTPGAPTTLPVTGPAGVAAVVTAVTGMSTAAYYWVIRRRGEV